MPLLEALHSGVQDCATYNERSKSHQAHSPAPLPIQKLGVGSKSEERVEGIRFHQELRDFILREMRDLGSTPLVHEHFEYRKSKKQIFTSQTLEAFKEVRDALKETRGTSAK